jgi:hypothetical protein
MEVRQTEWTWPVALGCSLILTVHARTHDPFALCSALLRSSSGFQHSADGGKYVGDFLEGLRHGSGSLIDAHGDRSFGSWSYGSLHGVATITSASGAIFEGEFAHGVAEGLGMEWDDQSNIIQAGRWHEGVLKERAVIPKA